MNYDDIGKFIQEKRKEKGLTQKELASKIGITDKAVSKWETGLGCPDVSILEILSKELDCSILELLKGKEIEGKVIPVTEANDYIKDSLNYGNQRIKDVINKIIIFMIVFITILLILLNIINIYNQHKKYYPEDLLYPEQIYQKRITDDLKMIKDNIDVMKNNQGKYSDEDYALILRNISYIEKSINNSIFLKYNGEGLTLNELYIMKYESTLNMNCLSLALAVSRMDSNYYEDAQIISDIVFSRYYDRNSDFELIYKYQLFDIEYLDYMYNSNIITKKMREVMVDTAILKKVTTNIIEVGDMNV